MKVSLLKSIPLLVLLLVGCTEDPSSKPDDPNNPDNAQLTLSVAELNYSDGGGSQSVVVRSNASWNVSGTNDWCTIDHADGSYDGEIRVTTQPNAGYDDRSANLTVKAGSVTRILTINQRKKDALTLAQARYEIKQGGEVIAVEVKNNIDFTVHIPQEFAGWIIPVATKGLAFSSLQFDIAANPGYDPREGKIIIRNSDGSLTDTLFIAQAQLDKLGLTEQRRTVVPEGGTVAVAVNTNLDYDITIPKEADWITLAPQTKGLRQEEYTFSVDAHTGFNSRSTEIVFKDRNTSTADTLYILQTSDIPVSVTTIGGGAFAGSQLTTVNIPQGVTTIASRTFGGCPQLTTVNLPEGVTAIEQEAFRNCQRLSSITLPSTITRWEHGVFMQCGLTHLTIPEGVTELGSALCQECKQLTSVILPSTLVSLSDGSWPPFTLYPQLASITCHATIPPSASLFGNIYGSNSPVSVYVPAASVEAYKAAPGWNKFTNIQPITD